MYINIVLQHHIKTVIRMNETKGRKIHFLHGLFIDDILCFKSLQTRVKLFNSMLYCIFKNCL